MISTVYNLSLVHPEEGLGKDEGKEAQDYQANKVWIFHLQGGRVRVPRGDLRQYL